MANGEPKRIASIKARVKMINNCFADIEKFEGVIYQNGRYINVIKDDVTIGSINIAKYKIENNDSSTPE